MMAGAYGRWLILELSPLLYCSDAFVYSQCCGARSSDFDSFVKLPGCKRGPHTATAVAAPAAAESSTVQRLKAAADAAPAAAVFRQRVLEKSAERRAAATASGGAGLLGALQAWWGRK